MHQRIDSFRWIIQTNWFTEMNQTSQCFMFEREHFRMTCSFTISVFSSAKPRCDKCVMIHRYCWKSCTSSKTADLKSRYWKTSSINTFNWLFPNTEHQPHSASSLCNLLTHRKRAFWCQSSIVCNLLTAVPEIFTTTQLNTFLRFQIIKTNTLGDIREIIKRKCIAA